MSFRACTEAIEAQFATTRASEATPEKKLVQELRSEKRQNPLSQFMITAPTFQKNAFMNIAPTFAEAVIKMNTAPT